MSGKILATHLERRAVVYVRQSTTAQVMDNTESTARQYRLKDRARSLGWSEGAIEVIDEDLGQSGKDTEQREGFKHLADSVSRGLVGGVFALEVSRLSRSSQDWQRLMALCAVAEVVIVDESTVYDPKHHDDKLLLDLKGTMSEAELHWLSLRLAGARRNKAQRGELYLRPPTGYVWSDGGYTLDPDESVQQAIRTLFDRFAVEPTLMAVVRWAHRTEYKVPTRVYVAGSDSEIQWRTLSATRMCNMLHDPVYAGVYAYGQFRREQVIRDGRIATRTRRLEPDSWSVKIQEAHPGYISWETYLHNTRKLFDNRLSHLHMGKGAAKQGAALLSGLVICGSCGRRMKPHYHGRLDNYHVYLCEGERAYGGGRCFSVPGRQIDRAVEELFLRMVIPEELSLTLAVEQEALAQAASLDKQWRLRIEQATYQARLCERRYKAVDPEHRVVARTLERQWNEALEALEEVQRQHQEACIRQKVVLSEADRRRVRELAADLPSVWRAETTRNDERKAMLRLVIEAIALTPIDVPQRETSVKIQWKSGAVDELSVPRPSRGDEYRTPEDVVARIRELCATGIHDSKIAEILNEEGYQTGRDKPFNILAVRWVRQRNEIRREDYRIGAPPLPDRFPDGRYSVRGLAKRFEVTKNVVDRWIRQGKVHGTKHPYGRHASTWWFELDEEAEAILEQDARDARRRLW